MQYQMDFANQGAPNFNATKQPASIAFGEQKAVCWDNPQPLKVLGIFLTSLCLRQTTIKDKTQINKILWIGNTQIMA